jgi:2,3-bisphosphoglycerate-independent phosphoglycerate mutase
MVEEALVESGVPRADFRLVPFPHSFPESDSGDAAQLGCNPLRHYTGRVALEGLGIGFGGQGAGAGADRLLAPMADGLGAEYVRLMLSRPVAWVAREAGGTHAGDRRRPEWTG